jgi:transcriptional regulator with XRE-family HTH domain
VEQIEETKVGRKTSLTPEIQEKLLAYIRKGLTYEKSGEALGISPATIQNWQARNKQFDNALKKARRDLEVSLLDSINLAGEKSWQAKAWILERGYNWAQPSARLAVTQDVTHGISSNLASLLAGIAVRKKEKKAEVIDLQEVVKDKAQPTTNHLSLNNYCINSKTSQPQSLTTNILKVKHKRMRLRKPRQSRPATTTPPATPPAPA